MLPMNKLVQDVAEFIKADGHVETSAQGSKWSRRDKIVLFANELSGKYSEHVSVELVSSLIVTYTDALDKEKDDETMDRGRVERVRIKA